MPTGLAIQPGSVLLVKLGRRKLAGVAVEVVDSSEIEPERVLPIDEIVGAIPPLPDDLRALAHFVASYYQEPIGQCFAQMLPPLGAGRQPRDVMVAAPSDAPLRSLNTEQRTALEAMLPDPPAFAPSLLQGVTGSGKTEVYLAAAARVVAMRRQVLLLAPEINLTPQLADRIAAALP